MVLFANFSFSLFVSKILSIFFRSSSEEEKTMAGRKKVVVVGGGVGGSLVAKKLEHDADVTLIDPKDYYEVPYAQLRSMVEPKFADRSVIRHADYLTTARHVASAAASVSGSEVVMASGDRVPFDFLVVATGTTFTGPSSRAERLKAFEAEKVKLTSANSVLIIGGGPVGVELAGEIVTDFPEKKVTLVHAGDRLIEYLGKKASQKTLKWLQSKKVEVILNDRVEVNVAAQAPQSGPDFVTKNGTRIQADAHFVCVGKRVGSSWLRDSDLGYLLDHEGRLKVDANLRLEGKSNVFAVGDIANTKEIKQGYLAGKQAAVVVENIKKLSKVAGGDGVAGKAPKLAVYKPLASPFGIVSLGRYEGVAQLPVMTIAGRMPGMIKSKDLFVGQSRKELGLTA